MTLIELSSYTILVIDDTATNLGVLTGYLHLQGFQIMIARNGRDGLEKARLGQPDLILLDVLMPGMDGYETCRQLKADPDTQEIPVIFITALQSMEDKLKAFAAGGVDYITKPLHEAEVLVRVRTHVQLQAQKKLLQQEIAERNRNETALRESEAHYRTLLDKFPDAVFIHDIAGKLFDVNEEACRRLGYSREELLQKHPSEFTQEKPREGYGYVLNQLRAHGHAMDESEHITKKGARIPCEIAMNLIQYQGQPMILSISRDTTERKLAEGQLRESEERYRALIENMGEGVVLMDERDQFIFANPAAELIFGVAQGGLLGCNLDQFASAGQKALIASQTIERRTSPKSMVQFEFTRQDGEHRWLMMTVTPRFSSGHYIGAFGILRDITEFLHLQKQGHQRIALEERQRIARDLHDAVSQTLFSARLTSEMMLHQKKTIKSEALWANIAHFAMLVKSALGEMRILLLELRPEGLINAELFTLLSHLIDAAGSRMEATFHLDIVQKCELPVDVKIAFYRIAQETLNNAIKHSRCKNISISLKSENKCVTLKLQDDGVGFNAQDMQEAHMGLSIMRERAAQIGASLQVTSRPEFGTSVTCSWQPDDGLK